SNIYNKEAYAYYSWLTRYIIEENGFEAFLEFFKSNDDWNIIGYRDKHDFCAQAYTALTASFDTRQ
ncbi:MAG: hypothetical protein JW760_14865, partial [Spirochaetales bacterium]|nr:hypothetical protein [Spirochaetales bacterium]